MPVESIPIAIRNAWPAFTGAMGTALLAGAVLLAHGLQQTLAPICTDYMYAWGWLCFFVWLPAAILATPARTSGAAWLRPFLHGIVWTIVWLWWFVAVGLAGLFERADLLFVAYFVIGCCLILWRTVLHRALLAWLAQRALSAASYAPGLITFAGAQPGDNSAGHASFHDRALAFVGRLRNAEWIAHSHRILFGPRGASAILLAEAMQSTDRRCLALRSSLASLEVVNPSERVEREALELGRAFLCETEVWLTTRRVSAEQPVGAAIQARALCVYAMLALAMARGSIRRSTDADAALTLLAANESFPTLALQLLRAAQRAEIGDIEQILVAGERLNDLGIAPRTIGRLSSAVALCRLQLYKQARGVLGNAYRELTLAATDEIQTALRTSAQQTLDALRGEVERASVATAGPERSDRPRSSEDRTVLAERARKGFSAMQSGVHPYTGETVTPSAFGRLPRPLRAREVGVGAIAGAVAITTWIVLAVPPLLRPMPDRLQTVVDVPFGGDIASDRIRSAAVATTNGSPTILLADPLAGVRTMDLGTLRAKHEGGTGTPLDGTVQKLASNPDGSALAVFRAATSTGADGSLCLSARDRSGRWHARIPPAALDVGGEDLEAALAGLSEPLFLRRYGSSRLLRYSEKSRSLVEADVKGLRVIQGSFVDFAESGAATTPKRIILLTSLEDGKKQWLYSITEPGSSARLEVESIGLPPLSSRSVVAICLAGTDRLVALDSEGGAWRTKNPNPTQGTDWERLRPGRQGLALDNIDLAAVTADGKRLWFVREGCVWTRPLEGSVDDESISPGWSVADLPPRTRQASAMKDRWQIMEQPNGMGGVYLLAPSGILENPGSALKLSIGIAPQILDGSGAEQIQTVELLSEGETLVDADAADGFAALAVVESPTPLSGTRFVRLEVLHSDRRALRRTPLLDGGFTLDRLLAVGISEGKAIVLDHSGRVIRFDVESDQILQAPGTPGKYIGQVDIPPDLAPRDAVIAARFAPESAFVLDDTGAVTEFKVAEGAQANAQHVRTALGPPVELLEPRFVFSDADGAMIFRDQSAWRFDALHPTRHFADQRAALGQSPFDFTFLLSEGTPELAWLSDGGTRIGRFQRGRFSTSPMNPAPMRLKDLRAGFGESCFAWGADDQLVSIDQNASVAELLRPQRGGPRDEIRYSAIRGGFVDFMTSDHLHSISRKDATWTSFEVNGEYELESIDGGRSVLLPKRNGSAYYYTADANAGDGTALTAPGGLTQARVLGEGVIGVSDDGPTWVGFANQQPTSLPRRLAEGNDLDHVVQVIESDGDLLLLGRTLPDGQAEAADRVLRYSFDGRSQRWDPPSGATERHSIELVGNSLYVQGGQRLLRLDANNLAVAHDYGPSLPPGALALGECDEGAHAPALLTERAIYALDPAAMRPMMVAPDVEAKDNLKIEWGAAWDDQIALFTDDGAWRRSARPEEPFNRVRHIQERIELAIIGGDGSPWALTPAGWISVSANRRVGTGIGWTAAGALISEASGQPQVGPNTIRGFAALKTGEANIGKLRGFEELGGGLVLLAGERGNLLFDPAERAFPETPTPIRDWDIRSLHPVPDGILALNEQRQAALIDSERRTVLFGQRAIEEVLPTRDPLAATSDGQILDTRGESVQNLPPTWSGSPIRTIGATSIGDLVYRLDDLGRIDCLDASSPGRATPVWIPTVGKTSAIARANGKLLAFDASLGELFVPTQPGTRWRVAGGKWFAGRNSVALASADREGVVTLVPADDQAQTEAAEPLPGVVMGNLANSTVAAMRRPDGTIILFDLLNGKAVSTHARGDSYFVDGESLWSAEGGVVRRTNAQGAEALSQQFDSTCAVVAKDGVRAFGLRLSNAEVQLVVVEPKTLGASVARRWMPRFPTLVSAPDDPLTSVQVGPRSRLIISRDTLALNDGQSVTLHPNPLRSTDIKLFDFLGDVFADGPDGTRILILESVAAEHRFPQHPSTPERVAGALEWAFYRLARLPLDPTSAPILVSLPGGTLDTRSGWILEEEPTRLSRTNRGIEVVFKAGRPETIPNTIPIPASPEPCLGVPLSLERGSIYATVDARRIELGPPLEGTLLKVHQVRAVAPIESGDGPNAQAVGVAWIDGAGQLWTRVGAERRCIDAGNTLEHFRIDEGGRVYAVGRKSVVGVPPNERVANNIDPTELLEDFRHLGGARGWIRWTRDRGDPVLGWQVVMGDGREENMRPCEAGFDLLSGGRLASSATGPCLVLRADPPLSVPIVKRGADWSVDWSAAPSPRAFANAPSARELSDVIRRNGATVLRLASAGAEYLLAGESFGFAPERARFDCNICIAASSLNGDLVTLLGNGKIALWSVQGNEAANPRFLPDPPRTPVVGMWPNASNELCIRTAASPEGASHWRYRNGAWEAFAPPQFTAKTNAEWRWTPGELQLTHTGVEYELALDQWPRLDFECLDLLARPRTLANGKIVYRARGAKWYALEAGLPKPRDLEPAKRPTTIAIGQLQIGLDDAKRPTCTLDGIPITLAVDDGLIADIDRWRRDAAILPLSSDTALVPVGQNGADGCLYRKVRIVNDGLALLPPVRTVDASSETYRRQQDGSLRLENHALHANNVDLGIPGESGFKQLDARSVVPLLHDAAGLLRFIAFGGAYEALTGANGRVLDSMKRTGDAPDVGGAEWFQKPNGEFAFAATTRNGTRLVMEQDGLRPIGSRPDQPGPMLARSDSNGEPFAVGVHGPTIELRKTGYEIRLVKGKNATIVPAHTQAVRILVSDGGFETYSDDGVAQYAIDDAGCILRSVRPLVEADSAKLLRPLPLGSGLFARRDPTGPHWSIGTESEAGHPAWPFAALSGTPNRLYSAGNGGILEVSGSWQRLTASGGTVRARAICARPHALATSDARRRGAHVLSDEGMYRSTSIEPSRDPVEVPNAGALRLRRGGPWAISLDRSGAALAVSYRDREVSADNGALSLEFAVAIGNSWSGPWLIDRLSSTSLLRPKAIRTLHAPQTIGVLSASEPARLSARSVQDKPVRVIEAGKDDGLLGFLLPREVGAQLEAVAPSTRIDSWSAGSRLDVRFVHSGQLEFRRIDALGRWLQYPPLARKDACIGGRFAFDSPQDVVRADHPSRSSAQACVVMKAGWEWLDGGGDGRAEFVIDQPKILEPEFGPFIRAEWLRETDLDPRTATPNTADSGTPIIWYPYGDRLFLVGERNVMWVELGRRWRGREVSPP